MDKAFNDKKMVSWALRIGLALVFLYAGISSLKNPLEWAGFLPGFLTNHFNATTLVKLFAIYELILVAWLVSGKFLKYCAILCFLTFGGILITNFGQLLITFRDVGLAFMAIALFFNERN